MAGFSESGYDKKEQAVYDKAYKKAKEEYIKKNKGKKSFWETKPLPVRAAREGLFAGKDAVADYRKSKKR